MIANLASFYICYRGKYSMNFYASHLKKYCFILKIFKFFWGQYRQKRCSFSVFLWYLYLTKNVSVWLEIYTVNICHDSVLMKKNELKRVNCWSINQYYLLHDKIAILLYFVHSHISWIDYARQLKFWLQRDLIEYLFHWKF